MEIKLFNIFEGLSTELVSSRFKEYVYQEIFLKEGNFIQQSCFFGRKSSELTVWSVSFIKEMKVYLK